MRRIKKMIAACALMAALFLAFASPLSATAATYDPNGTMADKSSGVTFATEVTSGYQNPITGQPFDSNVLDSDEANRTFTTDRDSDSSMGLTSYNSSTHPVFSGNYVDGSVINTGVSVSTATPQTGQHWYNTTVTSGPIYISQWTLEHVYAQCIHGTNTDYPGGWNDLRYVSGSSYTVSYLAHDMCRNFYNMKVQGWIGTCADCGEEIAILFYMTPETASQLYVYDLCKALKETDNYQYQ